MARTSAKTLFETVKLNGKHFQILESAGIWAVYLDGQPFNIRNSSFKVTKYKKTSFVNPGPAINLCRRLNSIFQTNRFTVIKLAIGSQVYP